MLIKKLNVHLDIKDEEWGFYSQMGFEMVELPSAEEPPKSEYEALKEKAVELGLEFHGNISKADLIKLIEGTEGGQQPA